MQVQYCTEAWPSSSSRHVYDVVFLCVVYVLPGTLTVALYARIGTTLWATDQALARQNSYVTNEGKIVSLFYITNRAEFNIYTLKSLVSFSTAGVPEAFHCIAAAVV
jgi:hypothetical protein